MQRQRFTIIARGPVRRFVAIVGIAYLSACAHRGPASPPPIASPDPEVREAKIQGGFITIRLEIPPNPPGPKPAVFAMINERNLLLEAGMVVVTHQVHWNLLAGLAPPNPDPPPKNTVGAWLLAAPTGKTVGQGYLGLIAHNATSAIPAVIDYLVTQPEIDPERIGIVGGSTGGFTALQAVAADRRIAVAAVMAGCGDYHTFLHLSNLGMNGAPLDLDRTYEQWLRTQEPYRHPERLVHAAVMMVNGTTDVAVPYPCALRTVRAFRRAYARAGVPERFRFVAIPGGGHNLGDSAVNETMAWLYRWLEPH